MHKIKLALLCMTLGAITLFSSACKKEDEVDLKSLHSTASTLSTTASTETTTAKETTTSAPTTSTAVIESTSIKTESNTHTDGNISIKYPSISDFGSNDASINALIKKNALSIIDAMGVKSTDTLSIGYKIISSSRKRMSIIYTGKLNTTNIFYTNTIDLETISDLGLADFTDPYTMAGYVLSDDVTLSGASTDITKAFLSYRSTLTLEELTALLSNSDFPLGTDTSVSFPQVFSYEKEGDIFFSIPVEASLGDYVIVKYSPSTK